MEQEDVAGKILLELLEIDIIQDNAQEIVYTYLLQAYAAGHDEGFDAGSHQRGKRKSVTQRKLDGTVVAVHRSLKEASVKMDLNVATIGRALRGALQTAGGYKWEYTDKIPVNVSEAPTVGSVKPKSTLPE